MAVIGKFFKLDDSKPKKISRMKGEYENLQKIRPYGFDTFPNYVVPPMGKDERVGLALLEEYIHGKDLNYYSRNALYERDDVSEGKAFGSFEISSFLP